MTFTNLVCVGQESFNYSDESYKVIKAVSKRTNYGLDRELLLSQRTPKAIFDYTSFNAFSNLLIKGLERLDIEGVINENDISELHQNIDFSISPKKWDKKLLRKFSIITTRRDNRKYSNQSYYRTSPPFFFKNNQFAIIYVFSHQYWDSVYYGIDVFKKDDSDEWEYFGEIFIGMS